MEDNKRKTVQELMDMSGRIAVITGGGGHLGLQMSKMFLELGAEVIVLGCTPEKIAPLEKQYPGKISFIVADLNHKETVQALEVTLPKEIDVLVNNALTWPKNPHFEKIEWDEVTNTLISGIVSPIFLSKIAFEKMIPRKKGSIINIASMYGMVSPDFRIYRSSNMSNAIEYGAVKAAAIQFTKYLAVKGAPFGIRVNAVSPGPFSPPGAFDNGKGWFRGELENKNPLHRIGENWEIKGVIAFLASDLSTFVTGQNIPVEGGWTIW